jgi:NADH:ubiquinone oxidoreductase subunit 3 (subunit A)
MSYLLIPPIAFVLYLALVGLMSGMGRLLAGPEKPNPLKQSSYTGGEEMSSKMGVPGYRPFFVVALFFAVLHLSVLVLGSSFASPIAILYLIGLIMVLLALILG